MKSAFAALLFLFVFVSTGFGQKMAKLSGKITNPTSEQVFLQKLEEVNGRPAMVVVDSCKLKKSGEFDLSIELDKPVEASFYDGNEYVTVYLDPGDDLYMTLNTSFFDETVQFSGKGSEKNNAWATLYMLQEVMMTSLYQKVEGAEDTTGLFSAYDRDHENYLGLIRDYGNAIPEFKEHAKQIEANTIAQKSMMRKYVLGDIAFNNKIKKLLGKPAIDFEGVDLEGNKTKLSDYKGQMIVVDFWATWCAPCKAEFPALKELEGKYKDDVAFLSVGVWCKEKEWKDMAESEGFSHNMFLDKEGANQLEEYVVQSIPRYLVIDESFNLIDADAPRPSSGELPDFWVK